MIHWIASTRKPRWRVAFGTFLILTALPTASHAQNSILDVGIRVQKTVGLYYENGVSIQYSDKRLKRAQLFFGISYVTSRLGTAIGSNAIRQDNVIVSASWCLRPARTIQPFGRINTGLFHADYEARIFDMLQNNSVILSTELGASVTFNNPLKFSASAGYNLVTGDGRDGPGTLYPLFVQLTASWDVLR